MSDTWYNDATTRFRTLENVDQHFLGGQHAALRGCWRALADAPSADHRAAWLAGYDSVPSDLRGLAPLTGEIPQELLGRLSASI